MCTTKVKVALQMSDIEVVYDEGLYLPALDLWLDAKVPRNRCLVSHGHSDHIEAHGAIIATPETARILAHRLTAFTGTAHLLPYGEPFDLPGRRPPTSRSTRRGTASVRRRH